MMRRIAIDPCMCHQFNIHNCCLPDATCRLIIIILTVVMETQDLCTHNYNNLIDIPKVEKKEEI